MELQTNRLLLRNFYPSDYSDLHEYLSDPTIVAFEPYSTLSLAQCKKEAIARSKSSSYLAICLKDTQKLIGHLYFAPKEYNTYEIGYALNSHYQKHGYALESVRLLFDYLFCTLHVRRIVAHCSSKNIASWRLMERLHMRREGCFLENASFKTDEHNQPIWFDSYQYAILAKEYEASPTTKQPTSLFSFTPISPLAQRHKQTRRYKMSSPSKSTRTFLYER